MTLTGRELAAIELMHFKVHVRETGIAEHLSDEALVLLFIALGKEMWRKKKAVRNVHRQESQVQ